MSNTDNALYQLLQTWGFSLTKSVDAAESTCIDVLWGGFVVKLYVDISFSTPLDTDANNHFAKLAVAAIAVAAVYAPAAIAVAAPTAVEFIQQLGSMTPSFAH